MPRRSSVSSDNLLKSVGSKPQLNSNNLDNLGIVMQGLQGHLDDNEHAHVRDTHMGDEGGEENAYQFTNLAKAGNLMTPLWPLSMADTISYAT